LLTHAHCGRTVHPRSPRLGHVRAWYAHHRISRPPLTPAHPTPGPQTHAPTPTAVLQHCRYPTTPPPDPHQYAAFHPRKSQSHPPLTRPVLVVDDTPQRCASLTRQVRQPGRLHHRVPSPEVNQALGHH